MGRKDGIWGWGFKIGVEVILYGWFGIKWGKVGFGGEDCDGGGEFWGGGVCVVGVGMVGGGGGGGERWFED